MDIIATILTATITSGVVASLFNWFIGSKERDDQRRWEIKRKACLDALEIIDARFSDYDWLSNGEVQEIDRQDFVPITEIRSCFNRLALACKDSKVPIAFENCLNLKVEGTEFEPITMNAVVDLRNSIRKELGFGKDIKTKVGWIKTINWRNVKK